MTHVHFLKDPKATKAKKHKKRTKAEVEYLERVKWLMCAIKDCQTRPCDAHHARINTGMGMKSSDYDTLPLCKNHHQGKEGFHTIGKKTWEAKYGTQREHVKQTQEELGYEENKKPDLFI